MTMSFLRTAGTWWRRLARQLGRAQTHLLVAIVYWLVVPVFSLVRLADPLRLRRNARHSFWIIRRPPRHSLEEARRQY